jgi:hypothetical protein
VHRVAGGLAELVAYLLAPDRGALDLLHALPWEPILQRLALAARPGAGPLPADAQQWATQLSLLSLQALVLLPVEHLPGWLVGLTASAPQDGGPAADDVILALRLPHIIAAADPHALQEVLCNCVEGLPFLLQPLVDAPSLLQVLEYSMKPYTLSFPFSVLVCHIDSKIFSNDMVCGFDTGRPGAAAVASCWAADSSGKDKHFCCGRSNGGFCDTGPHGHLRLPRIYQRPGSLPSC